MPEEPSMDDIDAFFFFDTRKTYQEYVDFCVERAQRKAQ